jgi:hypothetical protein
MTTLSCDSVCMAAMAIADGYRSELSPDQVEAHLAVCSECRQELGQLQTLTSLLNSQERRPRTENLWERIERRLPDHAPAQSPSRPWLPFVLLGALLLGYRIVEMIPDRDFGLLFKLVPILFVITAFSYLRENPFKVDAELRLEGE